jgi:hypothetical protein
MSEHKAAPLGHFEAVDPTTGILRRIDGTAWATPRPAGPAESSVFLLFPRCGPTQERPIDVLWIGQTDSHVA